MVAEQGHELGDYQGSEVTDSEYSGKLRQLRGLCLVVAFRMLRKASMTIYVDFRPAPQPVEQMPDFSGT